ncbi:hypothetical protein DLAC_06104 [Tieghemostelium lacteum]|uniref:Uncharacterized protein n=1 Tax=Tieghemostelium lacteum TaxID=361077 RepID=A0A151ZHH5_TIELA|nr:hypothetical protein DLAC_06104 [Tieghemostelium lacteum]|eukprot:KYQ93416.1 hypothetical protein DLAC_06104 [Tieghemostelium lacteum]
MQRFIKSSVSNIGKYANKSTIQNSKCTVSTLNNIFKNNSSAPVTVASTTSSTVSSLSSTTPLSNSIFKNKINNSRINTGISSTSLIFSILGNDDGG